MVNKEEEPVIVAMESFIEAWDKIVKLVPQATMIDASLTLLMTSPHMSHSIWAMATLGDYPLKSAINDLRVCVQLRKANSNISDYILGRVVILFLAELTDDKEFLQKVTVSWNNLRMMEKAKDGK